MMMMYVAKWRDRSRADKSNIRARFVSKCNLIRRMKEIFIFWCFDWAPLSRAHIVWWTLCIHNYSRSTRVSHLSIKLMTYVILLWSRWNVDPSLLQPEYGQNWVVNKSQANSTPLARARFSQLDMLSRQTLFMTNLFGSANWVVALCCWN